MHNVNSLSTFGAHPKEFDPEQIKPTLNNLAVYARKPNIAEPYVKKLLDIDPLTPINYFKLTMVYLMRGKLDLVISTFMKQSSLNPENRFGKWLFCRFLSWNNQLDEAFEMIDQIVNENSQDMVVVLSLFSKYALIGTKDKALQVMTEEVKSYLWNDPDLPWA
jgi:tetratricopeptide (TPR) repeat protein